MDKWIVAKEMALDQKEWRNPELGYVVVYTWPTFETKGEAQAFHKLNKLPLGWV